MILKGTGIEAEYIYMSKAGTMHAVRVILLFIHMSHCPCFVHVDEMCLSMSV